VFGVVVIVLGIVVVVVGCGWLWKVDVGRLVG